MNSPKEKAKELIDKFYQKFPLTMDVITTKGDLSWKYDNWKQAIECALIAVDEMIVQNGELYLNSLGDKTIQFYAEKNGYLFEVKKEIQAL